MRDTVLNLVFRCSHQRLTRPVTPVGKPGEPSGDTYVVCLECGKHFTYDAREMRLGKAINPTAGPENGGAPAEPGKPKRRRFWFALWASIPLLVLAGSKWLGRQQLK